MWKLFVEGSTLYMLQFEKIDDSYSFLVTDLQWFWKCSLTVDELVSNFKDENPLIDATSEQIVSNFLEMLENLQNVSICTEQNDYKLEVMFSRSFNDNGVSEQSLEYNIALQKVPGREVRENEEDNLKEAFMVSLLQTNYLLEKQKNMLINIIEKKDRELEEYRMEKGELSRSDLKTEKFDSNSLLVTSNNILLNIFNNEKNGEFWKLLTKKNGEVQTESLHVELEPWNAKPKKRVIHSGKDVVKKGSGVLFKKTKSS